MLAAHEVLVLLPERELPELLAALRAGGLDALGEGLVVAEPACAEVAERHHHAAGERGHVDDGRRFQLLLGVGQRVGEHQATFGVGVGDLDRHAVVHGDDVIRTHAVARDHVLGGGKQSVHLDGKVHLGDGLHGTEHGAAAELVVLHALHAVVHLQAVATGVVGEGLAHQHQALALGAARALLGNVCQVDEAALGVAAMAHGGQAAHPHLLGLLVIDDRALEAGLPGQLLGLRGHPGGIADVRGGGADAPGVVHGSAEEKAAAQPVPEVGVRRVHRQGATALGLAARGTVEAVHAPVGHGQALREGAAEGLDLGALLGEACREVDGDCLVAAAVQGLHQLGGCRPDRGRGHGPGLAEPQQDVLGAGGQHFAVLAAETRGLQGVRDGLDRGVGRRDGLAVGGDPDNRDVRTGGTDREGAEHGAGSLWGHGGGAEPGAGLPGWGAGVAGAQKHHRPVITDGAVGNLRVGSEFSRPSRLA